MLTEQEKAFIKINLNSDTIKLVLNQDKYPNLDVKKLANQINIRKKAIHKLPNWAKNPEIFFPSTISWQQCSSEFTAKYKANILKQISNGNKVVDLTGGFGVDSFYLAQQFDKVIYIEQQKALTEIINYNNKVFNKTNIEVINNDSLEYLDQLSDLDAIYLDPARRNERQQKIITLEDSTPNVIAIKERLLAKAKYVMVKTSPMLDIHKAIRSLESVCEVYVISVENECKELLFILNNDFRQLEDIQLTCVNISLKGQPQVFKTTWKEYKSITYTEPKTYLYDANKAILKGNIVDIVGDYFGFEKLAPNTQLLTGDELRKNFQGRIFEVVAVVKPSKKLIAKYLDNGKANLIVRNFPESVANLRKKWKIKNGGNVYLFAVTLAKTQKVVVVCQRLIFSTE